MRSLFAIYAPETARQNPFLVILCQAAETMINIGNIEESGCSRLHECSAVFVRSWGCWSASLSGFFHASLHLKTLNIMLF